MFSEIFTIPSYHIYSRKTRRKCAKNPQKTRKKRAKISAVELSTDYPQLSRKTKSRLLCPVPASGNIICVNVLIASCEMYWQLRSL